MQIRAGQVDVNAAPFNRRPTFGGYKHFGIRREIADYRIDDMLKVKAVQLTVSIADRKTPDSPQHTRQQPYLIVIYHDSNTLWRS